ncbi:MAG: cupin domain-containing protein [Candidatus Omnitrophica bacterium]|nr:cupin domain-containing protein [Candidatus Omnitrophota bacterium]MBU1996417.1 cupin domain-containing protein [Candidatus Omnitrophota bacterium]MBU4332843.1 cupin domain-containing protein [Candidatus Omnitrophota bacterium]
MLIRKFEDCQEIIAGDNCILREYLNPEKQDVDIRYSLAHAKVPIGETTWKHSLKTSEVYYILKGKGVMTIDEESRVLEKNDTVYIPPKAVQFIENTGDVDLEFICIVDPAWRKEDEVVQN